VHRVIYREWLQMALLSGALRLDSRISSNYYAVEWRPRGWKWVDPVNDLTAAALAIALGLDSRQRLAAEQGRDFEEIVLEIKQELEFADAQGVDVSGEMPAAEVRRRRPVAPGRSERGSQRGSERGPVDDPNADPSTDAIERRATCARCGSRSQSSNDGAAA
jgi:capsid protein